MSDDTRLYDHHDGSLRTLAPRAGLTPLEVFDLHAALGFARRAANGQPQVHPREHYLVFVERAIEALRRIDVWDGT